MPSSKVPRTLPHTLRQGLITLLLTCALAGMLALATSFGYLTTHNAVGEERTIPIVAIWQAFFARLPQDAPGILSATPLLLGLVVAILTLAYVLVATLRLPE